MKNLIDSVVIEIKSKATDKKNLVTYVFIKFLFIIRIMQLAYFVCFEGTLLMFIVFIFIKS